MKISTQDIPSISPEARFGATGLMAVHFECNALLLDLARAAAASSFHAHGYFIPAKELREFIWDCDEHPAALRLQELGWASDLSGRDLAFEREYSAFAGAFNLLQKLGVEADPTGRLILLAARLHLVGVRYPPSQLNLGDELISGNVWVTSRCRVYRCGTHICRTERERQQ